MKKYLLISAALFFLMACVFFAKNIVPAHADIPTFEVVPPGGTPYPTVTNVTVTTDQNSIIIGANASDVSGVLSLSVNIEDSNGNLMDIGGDHLMQDIGNGNFEKTIPVSDPSWNTGATYWVDIDATDNLLNESIIEDTKSPPDYKHVTSFVLNSLPTTINPWATYTEASFGSGGDTQGDPYNVYWTNTRVQFIILASELSDAGMQAGDKITGIYLKDNEAPTLDLENFKIGMKTTTASVTTSWESGWTTLYGPTTLNVVTPPIDLDVTTHDNWKRYQFSAGFPSAGWDGANNIEVNILKVDPADDPYGGIYKVKNVWSVGSERMFAGYCDSCDLDTRIGNSDNGDFDADGSVPEIKLDIAQ